MHVYSYMCIYMQTRTYMCICVLCMYYICIHVHICAYIYNDDCIRITLWPNKKLTWWPKELSQANDLKW